MPNIAPAVNPAAGILNTNGISPSGSFSSPFGPYPQTVPGMQSWAGFYGGNVQAPSFLPQTLGFSQAGAAPTQPGTYSGDWANSQTWANYFGGQYGFTAPQGAGGAAGALSAEQVSNQNDPALLGWEQDFGNPQTVLSNTPNWAQSLGAPNSNQGWQNPQAWAAYFGGNEGFTAPQGVGSPASALAAAAANAANPNNPSVLGWESLYNQASILGSNTDWAASLGAPPTNGNYSEGIGAFESPLAWAAYYGGLQGYGQPVDNTLQGAQHFEGITNPSDPSLLGWELDYGNPQTVVSAIQAQQAKQIAAQQAAEQKAAAAQQFNGGKPPTADTIVGNVVSVTTGDLGAGTGPLTYGRLQQLAAQQPILPFGYVFQFDQGFNPQTYLGNPNYGTWANWEGTNYYQLGGPTAGLGQGGLGTVPQPNDIVPFTVPTFSYAPATSGFQLGIQGGYVGSGGGAVPALNPTSDDVVGISITGEPIISPAIGNTLALGGTANGTIGGLNPFVTGAEPIGFLGAPFTFSGPEEAPALPSDNFLPAAAQLPLIGPAEGVDIFQSSPTQFSDTLGNLPPIISSLGGDLAQQIAAAVQGVGATDLAFSGPPDIGASGLDFSSYDPFSGIPYPTTTNSPFSGSISGEQEAALLAAIAGGVMLPPMAPYFAGGWLQQFLPQPSPPEQVINVDLPPLEAEPGAGVDQPPSLPEIVVRPTEPGEAPVSAPEQPAAPGQFPEGPQGEQLPGTVPYGSPLPPYQLPTQAPPVRFINPSLPGTLPQIPPSAAPVGPKAPPANVPAPSAGSKGAPVTAIPPNPVQIPGSQQTPQQPTAQPQTLPGTFSGMPPQYANPGDVFIAPPMEQQQKPQNRAQKFVSSIKNWTIGGVLGAAGMSANLLTKAGIDPNTKLNPNEPLQPQIDAIIGKLGILSRMAAPSALAGFLEEHGVSVASLQAALNAQHAQPTQQAWPAGPYSQPAPMEPFEPIPFTSALTPPQGAPNHPAPPQNASAPQPTSGRAPVGPSGLRMAPGRTETGAHMELNTLSPDLIGVVGAGQRKFEQNNPGYTVEAFSGRRRGAGQGPHASPAGALDMQIVGPNGVIPSEGKDTTGLYRQLAISIYSEMLAKYPQLVGRLNWGGFFNAEKGPGVADPATGANHPDLMHFDLMGQQPNRIGIGQLYRQLYQSTPQQSSGRGPLVISPAEIASATKQLVDFISNLFGSPASAQEMAKANGLPPINYYQMPPHPAAPPSPPPAPPDLPASTVFGPGQTAANQAIASHTAELNAAAQRIGVAPAALAMVSLEEDPSGNPNFGGRYKGLFQQQEGGGHAPFGLSHTVPGQISGYVDWWNSYGITQQLQAVGLQDLSGFTVPQQAALLQAFQFAPNEAGRIVLQVLQGQYGIPATARPQAKDLGNTSFQAMQSAFLPRYSGGAGAYLGPPN